MSQRDTNLPIPTCKVTYGDWQGDAYRHHRQWHLIPKQMSDYLTLDWKAQYRKMKGADYSEGMGIMPIPSGRGVQDTVTLTRPYFGYWMLSISEGKVPPEKRDLVAEMKRKLLDAIDRQLGQMFGMPGLAEPEDFAALPLPPVVLSQMEAGEVHQARAKVLGDMVGLNAARLMRIGLPATKVASLLNRSVYWARQHQRHCRRIGLVPLTPRDQRLLEQPSLFGEG